MKLQLPASVWLILSLWVLGAAGAAAAPVSRLDVRIVTGADELAAGSSLELRIYEAGKSVRRLPLVHGESWPRNSTHLIPVKLTETLDPRNVVRFGLYYRGRKPGGAGVRGRRCRGAVAFVIGIAERLLDATLSGVISRQGELATMDREQSAMTCKSDADCDDRRACNGRERCAPHSAGADARGCVKGTPVVCPVNQVCGEGVGCRGVSDPPQP